MAGDDQSSGWNFQRKDALYALALAATFGGGQILDRSADRGVASIPLLTERLQGVEKALAELRDPGGPVLRETVSRVKAHDELLREHTRELRSGVTSEAMDNLKQRLQEARDGDRELRQQIDGLRTSMDALRIEIAKVTSQRLVGPAR